MAEASHRRVCYFYDAEIGNFYYAPGHPMKPHRVRMCHNLLLNYHMYEKMDVFRPQLATEKDLTKFHADDYIQFLKHITPESQRQHLNMLQRFNLNDDTPVFTGLYNFVQIVAGGSIGSAVKLNMGKADIAINWAGGLHHTKKQQASGFCYVNDIVLAILELLKVHERVVYIDIDIHHGDGVEEAFFTTDRVMTVSFHKYGDYFPGTGGVKDIGVRAGKHYAVNFPLNDGMDDDSFKSIFEPVMDKIMQQYDPGAIVLQGGADSLAGDRLGTFNLTNRGHGACVRHMMKFNKPLMLVGGGGYTIRNVARCWAYDTSVCLGMKLQNDLPYNDYYEYFGPDHKLHFQSSNMENHNTQKYLESIKQKIFENLRHVSAKPGVQIGGAAETAPRKPLIDVDFAREPNPEARPDPRTAGGGRPPATLPSPNPLTKGVAHWSPVPASPQSTGSKSRDELREEFKQRIARSLSPNLPPGAAPPLEAGKASPPLESGAQSVANGERPKVETVKAEEGNTTEAVGVAEGGGASAGNGTEMEVDK